MIEEDVKQNLLAPNQWLRILIMAGFFLALWPLGIVLTVVMLVQTVTVLITGEPNLNLKRFGSQASAYLSQVVDFLVYGTEQRPFPFAPFPPAAGADPKADPVAASTGTQAEPAPAADAAPVANPPVQDDNPPYGGSTGSHPLG